MEIDPFLCISVNGSYKRSVVFRMQPRLPVAQNNTRLQWQDLLPRHESDRAHTI